MLLASVLRSRIDQRDQGRIMKDKTYTNENTFRGKLPSEGEKFEWEGYVFEVVDMDGRRVDKVLVRREDPSV